MAVTTTQQTTDAAKIQALTQRVTQLESTVVAMQMQIQKLQSRL